MPLKQAFDDYRQLMSFMKSRRKSYYIGLFGDSAVNASLTIMFSFVIQFLLNFAVHQDPAELQKAVYLVIGTVLLLSLTSPLCTYMYLRSIKITMGDIRKALYSHIVKLNSRAVESRHSGDLLSRLTNDVQTIEQTYGEHMKSIISQVLAFAGSIVVLFILDWRFAIVLIVLGVLSVLLNTRFAAPMRRISDKLQLQLGELTERLGDLIAGLTVIKMFGLKSIVTKLCTKASDEVSESGVKQGHQSGLLESGNFIIQFLSLGGVLLIGLIFVSRNQMELGILGQMVQLQSGISFMFLQLGAAVTLMQQSFAGVARVQEVLREPVETERMLEPAHSEPSKEQGGVALKSSLHVEAAIELNRVTFGYTPERLVLKELSLVAREGEVTAIVGPSGGGKSTLLKLLLGFYPVEQGLLSFYGRPASQYTLKEVRDLIAYVPQEATLFHGTIADNIRFGLQNATDEEVQAAAEAAFAHAFIQELPDGYNTLVGESGANLSGGQRQRIAIARALLKNAPILLLDEATSALDAEAEYAVKQALDKLMVGRTTLVIAHRLSTIEQAHSICVIADGQLQEQGTHEQLLAQGGLYAELYQLQFRASPMEESAAV
ncbi:ABC transporter ATP-binding protein [Paenibacillus sp. YYML68]|uniref:ABC transporter ATP-binding protein n=1 Tax=Paenibacillus sp. YYML68 TaxID=2909250 RepID=UPI002491A624|nr:ABC transporter ATP-binding protein [Paenibacillus sp. YYML68]